MEKKNEKKLIFWGILGIVLLCALALATFGVGAVAFAEQKMIETREDLFRAIRNAGSGDALLVGDVDFRMEGDGAKHEAERMILEKDLTIRCGKPSGKAVFTGGSFLLNGTKIAGVFSELSFENIVFKGPEDVSSLTEADWDLTYDEGTGDPVSDYTLKAQYAIMCKGNVRATFNGCEFNGYMHEQGPAVRLYYADYSSNEYAQLLYGDNSTCQADLQFTDCDFIENASYCGGGAVYAEGNSQNVTLRFNDCLFEKNVTGANEYVPMGGGAVCVSDTTLILNGCKFKDNEGNRFYEGAQNLYDPDSTTGGAVSVHPKCRIGVTDCVFIGNKASYGGGMAILASTGEIKGCVFDGNTAVSVPNDGAPDVKVLSSFGGKGGALYCNNPESVMLLNTTITRNVAENAYAAVCADYSENLERIGLGARRLDFLFCTVADNVANSTPDQFYQYGEESKKWMYYPGDFWSIPYVHTKCSAVIDELCGFYNRRETPTEENGYNYFGTPEQANSESLTLDYSTDRISLSCPFIVPKEYASALFPEKGTFLSSDLSIGASAAADVLYHDPKPDPLPIPVEEPDSQPIAEPQAQPEGQAKKPFPIYAIVLIVVFDTLFVAGIATILWHVFRRNKRARKPSDSPEESPEIAQKAEGNKHLDETDVEKIMRNPVLQTLSEREKEVLSAVLAGKKRKEIADALFVTESTVKKHIASVYNKLGVSSRAELLSLLYSLL